MTKLLYISKSTRYKVNFLEVEIEKWEDEEGYHTRGWIIWDEYEKFHHYIVNEYMDDFAALNFLMECIPWAPVELVNDEGEYEFKKLDTIRNKVYKVGDYKIKISRENDKTLLFVYNSSNSYLGHNAFVNIYRKYEKDINIIDELEEDDNYEILEDILDRRRYASLA